MIHSMLYTCWRITNPMLDVFACVPINEECSKNPETDRKNRDCAVSKQTRHLRRVSAKALANGLLLDSILTCSVDYYCYFL